METQKHVSISTELQKRFSHSALIQKILLINPPALPENDFDFVAAKKKRYSAFPPYGLLVIAEHLRNTGFDISIIDLNFIVLEAVQESTTGVDYRTTWRTALHQAIDATQPDVIGVTCMFTMTHTIFVEVVREAKRYAEVPVVIGGVHVTNDTERVLREIGVVDVACTHEAEISFLTLLQFLNGIRVAYQSLAQLALIIDDTYHVLGNRLSPTREALDIVPAYDLIPIAEYASVGSIGSFVSLLPSKVKSSTVLANRGCRAQCTFCSVRFFNGPGVRGRSITSIVDEIEILTDRHGIRHVMWLDDDLFYGDPVGLFNEIVRRNLRITWDASNGVIAAAMTPEIMAAASESGCVGLFFGFESGNSTMLREMKKPGTVDQYRKAAEIVRRYPHVFTRAFLMIGFPHETFGMMMETMRFAIETALDWYNITILQPLPSTPIYKSMLEEGLLEDQLRTGEVKFQVGPFGKQTQIEREERDHAKRFFDDALAVLKLSDIPSKDQLALIWFFMNYKVNYERIRGVSDPMKLHILQPFLGDIADRVTQDHALAHWSAAIVDAKTGAWVVAHERLETVKRVLGTSAYWRDKFEALDLYPAFEGFIDQVEKRSLVF